MCGLGGGGGADKKFISLKIILTLFNKLGEIGYQLTVKIRLLLVKHCKWCKTILKINIIQDGKGCLCTSNLKM